MVELPQAILRGKKKILHLQATGNFSVFHGGIFCFPSLLILEFGLLGIFAGLVHAAATAVCSYVPLPCCVQMFPCSHKFSMPAPLFHSDP